MASVLNSPQERQRLMTRLEYLLRQDETFSLISRILSEIADAPLPVRPDGAALREQLEAQRELIEHNEIDRARRALGQIGGALYAAQEQLHELDSRISVFQLRTRFQHTDSSRDEVAATLQFMLSKLNFSDDDFEKIDYLTTRFYALSIKSGGGFSFENKVRDEYQKMLDYAGITRMDTPDPEGMESLDFFREELNSATSFQQLAANETLDRFRAFKAGLQKRRLHPDVMVELARVNLLAGERFDQIARRASQRIDNLATKLLSAGVSEADELKEVETTRIEDVLKGSLLDAGQLNDDYKQNRGRIERLAKANDALARAHERLGLDTPVIPAIAVEIPVHTEEPALTPAPTPHELRQDLQARLQELAAELRARPLTEPASSAAITLHSGDSDFALSAWESAAFQKNYPGLRAGNNSLGSLFRVSVALVAELKEKEKLICRGLSQPHLHQAYLNSARYLVTFGHQMLRELDAHSSAALPPDICQQFQQTRHKLAGACTDFTARIHEAGA
ncbi:MAG: hypothetical protein U0Z53_15785 [Blastocatellia bacterium]